MTLLPVRYSPRLHDALPSSIKELFLAGRVWESQNHIVIQREVVFLETRLWHLSIKRKDDGRVGWTEKQQIKNSLIGSQHEGFELFPPESEKFDTSNQYHLWVFVDKDQRLGVRPYDRTPEDSEV